MASNKNLSSNNINNTNTNTRYDILRVDDDSETETETDDRSNNFEVTIEVKHLTRSQSDDDFVDLEQGISNCIAPFTNSPAFNDKDPQTRLIFDDVDCVFVDREQHLGGGGLEEAVVEEAVVEDEPLHVYLKILGFKEDDKSGTLGTISWVLAKLVASGIHPFPGRTYINIPTTDDLLAEGYDKFTESFKPDIALKSRKALDTIYQWIYTENSEALANMSVKINVQSIDNKVEFIFQKKTDTPSSTRHGGSTQADVDEVVAQVVATHLAENAKASAKTGGGSKTNHLPRDIVKESNTPKASAPKTSGKVGGSARPTPPRCASWPTSEIILADLAVAVPHMEGMVAAVTYSLTEGTPEEFATWCKSVTGKKSVEITAKKDGTPRVRVFAGDKAGYVKNAPVGGGASSKR